MRKVHDDLRIVFAEEFCHPFGAKNAAMLSAGAAKQHRKALETAFQVFLYGNFNDALRKLHKFSHFGFFGEEVDYLGILAGELGVFFVTTGIVDGAAVKHEAAAVARRVVWDALAVRKTHHRDRQRVFGGTVIEQFFV